MTGKKRGLSTSRQAEALNWLMMEPIAVSSCTTCVEEGSEGSTVFLFTMSGKSKLPFSSSSLSLRSFTLIQRLLVLKYMCLEISVANFMSSGLTWLISLSTSRPENLSLTIWPPFTSEGVRLATSIIKEAGREAK